MNPTSWPSPFAFLVFYMWLGLTFSIVLHFTFFLTGRGATGGVSVG